MLRSLALLLICSATCFSQQVVHPNTHAHNDYEHKRPLFDALQNGFTSIEADVHLVNGTILVSHDAPDPAKAKTLEQLYLRPLDSIARVNNGYIYPGYRSYVILMIDIKTNGEEIYPVLRKALLKYRSIIKTPMQDRAVLVLISGNRPIDLIKNDPDQLMTIDGRPDDLSKNIPVEIMPVISDSYKKYMTWKGKGKPPAEELEKIKALASLVHAQGKKFRLWATPDTKDAWQVLLDNGVDLINTDTLEELNNFLTSSGR
jgi:hypothetical protein